MSLFAKLGDFMGRATSRMPPAAPPEDAAKTKMRRLRELQMLLGRANRERDTAKAAELERELESLL